MNLPVKKIISASAGTGKTYRLSLEFLVLLLKYWNTPDFKPDQILVITFTRKATAEIRERIFRHLETLLSKKDGWYDLAKNLKLVLDKDAEFDQENPLSEADFKILDAVYRHLSTHKDELQVMTIDSYVHSIFRNLIRPVRGIDRFELDLKAVDKRIPFLFNELMTPALLRRISGLLSRRLKPSLDEFKAFFRSLIDNRWLFYLATQRSVNAPQGSIAYYTMHPELWQARADEYKNSFLGVFKEIISDFAAYLKQKKELTLSEDIINAGLLNREFLQLFAPLSNSFVNLSQALETYLKDEYTMLQLLKLLDKEKYIWNGQKVRASKTLTTLNEWKANHKLALGYLSNYLLFHLFLPEQHEILDIWKEILSAYDKLIYRYKNFTYDDIAWFTFEALYSSHPPLFEAETEAIANEFYEFMTHRTRFMLIDEFQDTSLLQFHILSPMIDELLAGEGSYPYGGMIIVGDEKQSIFSWRGGQRDLLLNLDTIFQKGQKAEKDALKESWRSSPTLMNFINGIFNQADLQEFLKNLQADWVYTDIAGKKLELENDTVIQFKLGNYASHSLDNKMDKALRSFVTDMVIPALPKSHEASRTTAILARRNEELEMIRAILAENGITSEFQSSKSLLDHNIIKAVFFLLKFAVYHDWYDFLAFLRSDLIMMDGATLKQVINIISSYQQDKSEPKAEPDFTTIPKAQAALELAGLIKLAEIYQSILIILQICQIQHKLPLPRDFVNVQRFLDLALDYEQQYQNDLPELQGFIRYCEDNRDQEIMQQQDVESSTAVQLLTIHKSKGLEFDSVFVWWNLKSFRGREESRLSSWVRYTDKSYHNLSDIALSLHYNKVLETSSYKDIMLEDEKRGQLEELNNLYVALTRAKSRLFLYAAFDKQDGWTKYWTDLQTEERLTPPHYAIKSAWEYMQSYATQQDDDSWLISNLSTESDLAQCPEPQNDQTQKTEIVNLRDILPDWQNPEPALMQKENYNPDQNMKQSFLVDRDNLKGNIAHYFLAQLKYTSQEEIDIARTLTLRQFGNLMTAKDLTQLIDKIEQQISALADLFKPEYDIIYNEYPITHYGKEYRLDRLMLNTKAKTYRIIDYKTGGVYDEEQLNHYNSVIKEKLLPSDYVLEQELKTTEIKL